METIDLSAPDPEEQHETSFQRAAAQMWGDRLLKPFSARRLVAAQACGLRIFRVAVNVVDGKPGMYDGIFWDALISLYLRLADDTESLIAVRHPDAVTDRALAWADEQQLTPASPKFPEMIGIFSSSIEDIMGNATEPADAAVGSGPSEKKRTSASHGSQSSPSRSATSQAESPATSS